MSQVRNEPFDSILFSLGLIWFYSVIGNGQSGTDISVDLIDHAKSVTLIGKNNVPALPENISEVNDWFKSIAPDGLILNNGELVKSDVFILCTGYIFDYTFAQVRCKNSIYFYFELKPLKTLLRTFFHWIRAVKRFLIFIIK